MTTTPQVLLDRYEVGRLLGAGGMAEVFEGRDRLLARRGRWPAGRSGRLARIPSTPPAGALKGARSGSGK